MHQSPTGVRREAHAAGAAFDPEAFRGTKLMAHVMLVRAPVNFANFTGFSGVIWSSEHGLHTKLVAANERNVLHSNFHISGLGCDNLQCDVKLLLGVTAAKPRVPGPLKVGPRSSLPFVFGSSSSYFSSSFVRRHVELPPWLHQLFRFGYSS